MKGEAGTEDINDSEIQIPGFSVIRCDQIMGDSGGVLIYVKDTPTFHFMFA